MVALTEAERRFGLGHGRRVITPDTGLGLRRHFPFDFIGPICADGHRGCSTTSKCASAAVGLGRLVSDEELLALAASGNAVAVPVGRSTA